MLEVIRKTIRYCESKIKQLSDYHTSRGESDRGKQWRKSMNHSQRAHRSKLEGIHLGLSAVRDCFRELRKEPKYDNMSGQEAVEDLARRMGKEINPYINQLEPHTNQKRTGDYKRMKGNANYREPVA